jgi:hypothetical protein
MATRRTSFLKRQKEMKRNERALEKREARKRNREEKAAFGAVAPPPDLLVIETEQNREAGD